MLVDPAGVERKLACGEPACPVTKRRLEALYHAIVHKLKPPIIKGRPS